MKRTILLLGLFMVLISTGCVTTHQGGPSSGDTARNASYDEARDLYNLGVIAFDAGNYEVALEYLNQSKTLWTGSKEGEAEVLLARARVYSAIDQYDLALADIARLIVQSPDNPEAYFERAVISYRLGNVSSAEDDLLSALTIDPTYARAHNLMGVIHRSRNNPELALASINNAVRYDDSYAPAYYNRGLIKFDMGDWEGAVADFSEAIVRYTDDQTDYLAQAHCRRAEAFLMLGNAKMAEKDRERAEILSPGMCDSGQDLNEVRGKGGISR
ncbi:MAG: tetratricopeptide repeat protein [Deltaproteobacteria bacterium]|nr:tetratricopeptide repeat protein [Candidatus Zymogenaceae bacterium]